MMFRLQKMLGRLASLQFVMSPVCVSAHFFPHFCCPDVTFYVSGSDGVRAVLQRCAAWT